MSLPVTTTITGMDKLDILQQNLRIAQDFQSDVAPRTCRPCSDRSKPVAADGHFELYKVSIKFDNPEARFAHGFPLDMQSDEVKEMVLTPQNEWPSVAGDSERNFAGKRSNERGRMPWRSMVKRIRIMTCRGGLS